MSKRKYRAIAVKSVDSEKLIERLSDWVTFGCDAAKERWLGVFMNPDGEVLLTVSWDLLEDSEEIVMLLESIRAADVTVEIAAEPTGTYAEALVWRLEQAKFPVFQISPKHSHDYAEIYDGVPSSHDAKAAAVVAELHRTRRERSRPWPRLSDERRALRAQADLADWEKADALRYHNRLEAKLALYWPELGRILDLKSATAVTLVGSFGGPGAVAAAPDDARQLMKRASRGQLAPEKINAVLESARTTLGLAQLGEEVAAVKWLGAKLAQSRRTVREAVENLAATAEGNEVVERLAAEIGIGTAAVLTARLGDLRDYASVGATYRGAGINIKERSSGKHKGKLKITKRGPSTVRRWLFLAVLRWIQKDPIAKAWYARKLRRNGGNKLKGLVALMRKLLAGLFHVARGEAFDSTKLFDVRRLQVAD